MQVGPCESDGMVRCGQTITHLNTYMILFSIQHKMTYEAD